MKPGEIYNVEIIIDDLAITFLKGHKLRVVITCSNYPEYDINLNNGGEINQPGDTLTAINKIYFNYGNSRVEIANRIFSDLQDVPENAERSDISVYPNPAEDVAYINFPNLSGTIMKIEISSMIGQNYLSEIIAPENGKIKVDVTGWPSGLYFVKISTGRNIYFARFMVKK
jgi:hypothetical protein